LESLKCLLSSDVEEAYIVAKEEDESMCKSVWDIVVKLENKMAHPIHKFVSKYTVSKDCDVDETSWKQKDVDTYPPKWFN